MISQSVKYRSSQSAEHDAVGRGQEEEDKQMCETHQLPFDQEKTMEATNMVRNKLLESGRFKWEDKFKSRIDVQVLETNFEWMRVILHYGNYRLEILVIYTEIEEGVFENDNAKNGSFGVVRFLQFEGSNYAVKGVKFSYKDNDIDAIDAYKEYFLAYMAGILQVGPKVLPLFCYDILLTKNMAFFSMEECQPAKLQSEFLESELLDNVKTMHAVKLIHGDIKPDNVAYSLQLEKHVFIDFGLSRLIVQSLGEKTKTKFYGTLFYSSEQMKKCYLLQAAKLVDLYANDLCCLSKTIQGIKKLVKIHKFSKKGSEFSRQEVIKTLDIFQHVIEVLRLKYFIKTQSKEKILKILRKLNITKIICQIFSDSEIPKSISEDEKIKETLDMIKNSVFINKFQIDKIDQILCILFSQEKKIISAEKIVPISQILSAEPEFFDRYLIKPELVLKLFHFFDPFSDCLQEVENKWKLKRVIVEKIYELKGIGLKNPVFFCQKVRFALLYFYQKLKHLNNLRVLLSLRLCFISLQLWSVVEELQNEIIEIIDDQFLKVLKILEFSLFRSFFLWDFRRSNQKWIYQVMRLPLNFASFQEQAMKILQIISSLRCSSSFQEELLRHKQLFMQKIMAASRECPEAFEKQSLRNIRYFYAHLCETQPTQNQQAFNFKYIELKIYSRCWDHNSFQYSSFQYQQVKLFWPLKNQLEFFTKSFEFENFLFALINNQFQTLKNRNEPLPSFLSQMLRLRAIKKATLYFFKEKIQELILSKQREIDSVRSGERGGVSINRFNWANMEYDVEEVIVSINIFIQFVQRNSALCYTKESIDKQNKILLMYDLSRTFNQFVDSQSVQLILNNSFYVRTDTLITQTKLKLQLDPDPNSLRPTIQAISTLLQPFPSCHPNLISNFLTLHTLFQPDFPRLHPHPHPLPQPNHFPKSLLLNLTQKYIKQKKFQIFLTSHRILLDYVTINNQEGRVGKNLEFMEDMMEEFRDKGWGSFVGWNGVVIFYQILERFCWGLGALGPETIVNAYKQVRFNKIQWSCGFYAYFVFQLFLCAGPYLPQSQQHRQIKITTLRLQSMPHLYQLHTLQKLSKLFKNLPATLLKSRRKILTCQRLQLKYAIQHNTTTSFIRRLGIRIEKIGQFRRNREIVVGRFREKIQRFYK